MKSKKYVIVMGLIVVSLIALVPDYRFGPDFRLSSKVIDPDGDGFNEEVFNYNDYNDYDDLVYVLKRIFPIGSDKARILDKFNDSFGGLRPNVIQEHDNKSLSESSRNFIEESELILDFGRLYPLETCFWSTGRGADKLIFVFDEKQKLKNLYIRFSCTIATGRI